ncbi:MAG: ABC-F family ATP-binding cassette domain-containing protein [Hyphomonadaceae bacterium]
MSRGRALAQFKKVRLMMGAEPLFDGVDAVLNEGERVCLVGDNGVGKSTLMRMLAGLMEPDGGEIVLASGAAIAYAPQEPDFSAFATLREAAQARSARAGADTPTPAHAADAALAAFGLDPARSPEGLSGGEMRRASLARAFAAEADLLLLDEPTNHLDIPAIEALEARIKAYRGASLVISHDRRFLERISTATLWLRRRRAFRLERGFAAFEDWAERIETEEARAFARLETHLAAEEHWLRRGVTARRARNEGRRRKLDALRAERRAQGALRQSGRAAMEAEKGEAGAKLLIEAKGLCKSFGARAIVRDLDLRVTRGDRIGIVGPNGAGKTTLIELLLERLAPDSGSIRTAQTLEIAYVDQTRAVLDPNATIWETLAPAGGDQVMVRGRPRHVAGYAKDFLFDASQLRQPVSALSGGERNRLALAVELTRKADLLVLDEPTNDLDMDTLDSLEEMLAAYDGAVLLVSHDRAFLDGVATQILGATGAGRWVETPGGWADFEREHGGFVASSQQNVVKSPAADTRTPRPARKLSYKQERRIGELETLAAALEAEIAVLEAHMADPGAFARDPKAYEAAARRLDAARHEKDSAETEWLEIEEQRSALAKES